jgi:glycosyltransferase involved in cell wall biosynthesis
MAILEAMSIKKPVLVSDFPPMIEAVEHLKTGYISKVANEDSLKEGIEYFSANKEKINSMGEAAYNKLLNEFTVDKIADTYLNDFEIMQRSNHDK